MLKLYRMPFWLSILKKSQDDEPWQERYLGSIRSDALPFHY